MPENTPIVESTPMEENTPAEKNDPTEDGASVEESDRAEENNLLGGDSMDEQTFHNGDEGKQVVIYFANWNLGNSAADASGEVGNIPWDKVTYVNHAFWAVAPADGSTETSFVRRDSGEGARTEFAIVSTDPYKDYQNTGKSAINPELEKNHFAQYAAYSELYPDVNIMISVGGWGACGYFSEMAYTKEGRQSFIQSCLDLMDQYPWIDGIDIDWEYPGGTRGGERAPGNAYDQGCPIFGTAAEDSTNFAALLSELRSAMDEHFGTGTKRLTACASGSTGWTLPMQDWAAFAPYLDMINIMTYDLAGVWDGSTGHGSSLADAINAAEYFRALDIDMSKLCIGSPMYATSFLLKNIPDGSPLGAAVSSNSPTSSVIDETMLRSFEEQAVSGFHLMQEGTRWVMGEEFDEGGVGWHYAYDAQKGGVYLYNDDESSRYYKWFLSYENPLSLQAKLDYIHDAGLAGIIVWECSQDTSDHDLISQMGDNLIR